MNEEVQEWLSKADEDFRVAQREAAVVDGASHGAVVFHSQQCVEKLIKGLLIDRSITPPKTHDLLILHELLTGIEPSWSWPVDELVSLSKGAVRVRYPLYSPTRDEAAHAMTLCTRLRAALLPLFSK